jgi:hypothetical protein
MDDVYALNEENICPITYNVLADAQHKEFTPE